MQQYSNYGREAHPASVLQIFLLPPVHRAGTRPISGIRELRETGAPGPACWQRRVEQRLSILLRSTYFAAHPPQFRVVRYRWNRPQR